MPKDGQYQTNVRFRDSAETGLRRTPRFTVKLSAEMFVRNSLEPLPAIITDISGDGAWGRGFPLVLAAGEPIVVSSEMNIAFGVIRYCRERSLNIFHVRRRTASRGRETRPVKDSRGTMRRFARMISFISRVGDGELRLTAFDGRDSSGAGGFRLGTRRIADREVRSV